MSEVIYKIRVNRPCRLFIDDEEVAILEELKLAKFNLPEGEYLRKVMAIDNSAIYDETEITLSGASKLENITLDTTGLDEAKHNALPKEAFQVGELMYQASADGKGVSVAKYVDKNLTAIVIPEQISYANYLYDVVNIRDYAFWECESLTSITIPNSVTSIGEGAFSECTSLNSISIPNSVTAIGEYAFSECTSLNSISIPNSVTAIGEYAFWCCKSLTSITIPNSVTSIGESAFWGCKSLTSITIPNSVTSIGESAFRNCTSLTSITIPNSVTSIGKNALSSCKSLTVIEVENGNTIYDSRNNCNAIIETISNTLIAGCKQTIIPNSVTSIGVRAFSGCSSLTSITIPNSVTNIGNGAFNGCSSLTSIVIPNSVTSIGEETFKGCSSLTSVALPNTLINIGKCVFCGCFNLTSITIPNSVKSIGSGAFCSCSSIKVESNNEVYDSRNGCNAIIETATNTLIIGCQNTIVPNSIISIGERAFCNCKSMTSITLPQSVKNIGYKAFHNCSSLKTITIPNSVIAIGEGAFLEHTEVIRE